MEERRIPNRYGHVTVTAQALEGSRGLELLELSRLESCLADWAVSSLRRFPDRLEELVTDSNIAKTGPPTDYRQSVPISYNGGSVEVAFHVHLEHIDPGPHLFAEMMADYLEQARTHISEHFNRPGDPTAVHDALRSRIISGAGDLLREVVSQHTWSDFPLQGNDGTLYGPGHTPDGLLIPWRPPQDSRSGRSREQ